MRAIVYFTSLCLSLAAVTCVLPADVFALDAHKTAEALAQRAAKAFESGDMRAAATLYREAYRIDGSESAYLYGAARASHSGRDLAHAEEDYLAFIALPTADPARVAKAKGFLDTLHAELSTEKVAEAKAAETSGDALLAATLYLEAWRISPERAEPLLKAAMLERKLGDKKNAVDHLRRYLQLAAADATGRGTAEALLKELGGAPVQTKAIDPRADEEKAKAEAEKAEKAAAQKAAAERDAKEKLAAEKAASDKRAREPAESEAERTKAAPSSTSGRRIGGWTSIGVGAGALIGAGILAILASGQQSTLDTNLMPDGYFDSTRISVADAASTQQSINSKWLGTGILAGVGAVGVGVGTWLVLSDKPSAVTLLPRGGGFSLAGRF